MNNLKILPKIFTTMHFHKQHYAVINNVKTKEFPTEIDLCNYLDSCLLFIGRHYEAIESKKINGDSKTCRILWRDKRILSGLDSRELNRMQGRDFKLKD